MENELPWLIQTTEINKNEREAVTNTQRETTNVLATRKDRFLDNPSNQPKKEIADYVEQEWILVPRRFSGLKEALEYVNRWGKIMIRSEHAQEYDGASWLLKSIYVDKEEIEKAKKRSIGNWKCILDDMDYLLWAVESLSQEDLETKIKELSNENITKYCMYLWIDIQQFKQGITYSYWEKIDWYNRSIIADTAIPWRYYIFTKSKLYSLSDKKYSDIEIVNNCSIVDNGEIILDTEQWVGDEIKKRYQEVIAFYEKIRSLEKFNPNHCPIIEFQTDKENNNYFLQYHRTRDMETSTFVLERPLEEGEIKVGFVRWATPPEGIEIQAMLDFWSLKIQHGFKGKEECYMVFSNNEICHSIKSKERKIHIHMRSNLESFFWYLLHEHIKKTVMFNPSMSLVFIWDWFPKERYNSLKEEYIRTKKIVLFPMRVVSDWRTAYVKFLDHK